MLQWDQGASSSKYKDYSNKLLLTGNEKWPDRSLQLSSSLTRPEYNDTLRPGMGSFSCKHCRLKSAYIKSYF